MEEEGRRRDAENQGQGQKRERERRKVEDYDDDTLPSTYEMGNLITLIPNRLHVGPAPTTRRQRRFLRERMGDPFLLQVELPDLTERRLWKTEESIHWFGTYARKLYRQHVLEAETPIDTFYVYYKTGCEEEMVVAALLWVLLAPEQVPKTVEAWKAWRESNAYLWIWDERLDETLAVVHGAVSDLMPAQEAKSSASASVMANWLRKSKDKN